jgi:hypothetical protein
MKKEIVTALLLILPTVALLDATFPGESSPVDPGIAKGQLIAQANEESVIDLQHPRGGEGS